MARGHGKKAKVYATGVDISSYLKGAASSGEADLADSSGLGDDDKTFVVGMQQGKLSLDGMFGAKGKVEGEVSQIADVLEAAFGVSPISAIHLPQGDGLGNAAKIVSGPASALEITTPYSDVGKLSAEITSNYGLDAGKVLKAKGEVTEGKEETALNNAAKSEHGGLGALQVFSITAGKSLTVKIQHSADNETFVDLITFTAATTGEVAEVKALALTAEVKQYVRALWTLTGGAATFHTSFARTI